MRHIRIGAVLVAALLVASTAVGVLGQSPAASPAASEPSASAAASPHPHGLVATATDGAFTLVLSVPRSIWSVHEAIEGEAVLSVTLRGTGRGQWFGIRTDVLQLP